MIGFRTVPVLVNGREVGWARVSLEGSLMLINLDDSGAGLEIQKHLQAGDLSSISVDSRKKK